MCQQLKFSQTAKLRIFVSTVGWEHFFHQLLHAVYAFGTSLRVGQDKIYFLFLESPLNDLAGLKTLTRADIDFLGEMLSKLLPQSLHRETGHVEIVSQPMLKSHHNFGAILGVSR